MTTTTACAVALVGVTALYIARRYLWQAKPVLPLPPGPPGLPWIGNVVGIDTNAPWVTYREWAKRYGNIIHTRVLGMDVIIINSEKIATDLLDKHSSNNSDRPHFITGDLCGIGFSSALLPYGDKWRLHRRFFHQTYRVNAVQRFIPFQHRRICQFLRQLLSAPERLDEHVFEYTASIILNSAYDYEPKSHDDELLKTVAKVQEVALSVVRPGITILVSVFPAVLKLPAWLPGMSFKTEMADARKLTKHYVDTAFEYALERMCDPDDAAPSMVQDGLQSSEKGMRLNKAWMTGLKEASATSFLAGSETSRAFLMTFFFLMTLNPVAQQRAQAQIDAVVGKDRLPTMDDRPLLPFVDAVFREIHRHTPIVPLSVPHAAINDDVYCGYHIPKGAFLLANLWSMSHDESRYQNPDAFLPERFLNDDGSLKPDDTEHISYGFGRRICAGRFFAEVSVWALIAKVLAVFKILKPLDEDGNEIAVEQKFSNGLIIHPLGFQCRFVPRVPGMNAEKLEELIAASTP